MFSIEFAHLGETITENKGRKTLRLNFANVMIFAHKFANYLEEFNLEAKQQNLTYPDLSNQLLHECF